MLFSVRLRDGTAFTLADLPGYGFAERAKSERVAWKALIESYIVSRASLIAVVLLVDCRRGLTSDDQQLIDWLRHLNRPVIITLTKADKLSRAALASVVAETRNETRFPVLAASGESGEGRDELLKQLARLLHREDALLAQHDTDPHDSSNRA